MQNRDEIASRQGVCMYMWVLLFVCAPANHVFSESCVCACACSCARSCLRLYACFQGHAPGWCIPLAGDSCAHVWAAGGGGHPGGLGGHAAPGREALPHGGAGRSFPGHRALHPHPPGMHLCLGVVLVQCLSMCMGWGGTHGSGGGQGPACLPRWGQVSQGP